MAAILWGPYWAGKRVRCLCDNMAVAATVNKKTAKDPLLARLLRILALVSALLDISISAQHLPGINNASADALSRGNVSLFFSLNPQASPIPVIIPQELLDLVLNLKAWWISQTYTGLLISSLTAALRLPPLQPTNLPSRGISLSVSDSASPSHTPS